MRGVLHKWGFFAAVAASVWLVLQHLDQSLWPTIVFVSGVCGLLGTSALYHRVTWNEAWYARIRVIDHAMIFALILGTYTPLFVVALEGRRAGLFAATCAVAAVGILVTLLWQSAPKWVRALIYLTVGWMGALIAPDLVDAIGWSGMGMLFAGGIVYSIGALFYALKRPNPFPGVFGYHELFHAMVILAAGLHFAVVSFWVLA